VLMLENRKRKKLFTIILVMVLIWLPASSAQGFNWFFWQNEDKKENAKEIKLAESIEMAKQFDSKISRMANELVSSLEDSDPESGLLADGMIICIFVELKKLYRTSSFGRYLAEQLMGEFQRKKFIVSEIRKSSTVLIRPKYGEFGLSREPEEINTSVQAGAMLTGTYTITENHILVNAKIIDNRNSTLLSSAKMIFPRDHLSNILLSDSATAHNTQNQVLYMKRLEL
jgi:TolB-like protein